MRRAGVLAVALTGALAASTHAEIFKCIGPTGEVRFTSDASQCPNAALHAPKQGALQRVDKAQPPLASARPGAQSVRRAESPEAQGASPVSAEAWLEKKQEADRNLRELEASHERVLAAVRWCNKGLGVTTENPRTGLRERVRCDDIDDERVKIEKKLEKARAYSATGLEEECRQAGCLPGWVR